MTGGPRAFPVGRLGPWLAAIGLAALLAPSLLASERFPPPEFDNHHLPVTATPAPRAGVLDHVDVLVLAACLGLAAYLALKRRSRRELAALAIFSIVYFGFWRRGCICPVGSLQNVSLAFSDGSYAIPATVLAFFLLPLVFALFFGRVFCAAVCPLGMAQDVVALRPLAIPRWIERALRLFAFAYLGLAVLFVATGAGFVVCRYDPFVGFYRRTGSLEMILAGVIILLIGVFIARPYCRFLCPYGVLLGWFSRLAWRHAAITPAECIRCRLCEESCPFGAINAPAEWSGLARGAGKRGLAVTLALVPLLAAGGAWAGSRLALPLSRCHATVQLAESVWKENAGEVREPSVAGEAFRATGRPVDQLYREALDVRHRFAVGSALFGAFMGLALGAQLVAASVRRRRADYEPDRTLCLSCGRCFLSCPIERERLKKLKAPGAA